MRHLIAIKSLTGEDDDDDGFDVRLTAIMMMIMMVNQMYHRHDCRKKSLTAPTQARLNHKLQAPWNGPFQAFLVLCIASTSKPKPHETTKFMPNGHRRTSNYVPSLIKHFPGYIINQHSHESQSRNPAVGAFFPLQTRIEDGSLCLPMVPVLLRMGLTVKQVPSCLN